MNRRLLAFSLSAISGGAGLVHEVLWTRRMVDIIGGSAEATSRVIGAFFFGLAAGALLTAWRLPRLRSGFLAAAVAECLTVLLALPLIGSSWWVSRVFSGVGTGSDSLLSGVRFLLSVALVVPPAAAMGAVLPLVILGLRQEGQNSPRTTITLYSVNTLGGGAGILLAVAALLPWLGLTGGLLAALAGNVLAALLCWYLHCSRPVFVPGDGPRDVSSTPIQVPVPLREPLPEGRSLLIALFSGLGVMSVEVLAMHTLMLVATMSLFVPAAVLTTFVCTLAAAAYLYSVQRPVRSQVAARVGLLLGVGFLSLAPLAFIFAVQAVPLPNGGQGVAAFSFRLAGLALAVFGLPILCIGLLFPSLMVNGRNSGPSGAAWLLAANGFGGLLGAELTQHLLLPQLGPYAGFGLVACAYAVFLVLQRPVVLWGLSSRGLGGVALAAALALTGTVLIKLPTVNPHMGFRVLAEGSDAAGRLAVVIHERMGKALLVNNQYVLGSEAARYDQERQAHLPLVLHASPRHVGFVGVATGSTPGAALLHQTVRSVEAVEISEQVVQAAATHFATLNHGLFTDPRARVRVDDGRMMLSSAPESFDVVIADLFLPWSSGVGRLYSLEHFESVRGALRSGGLFCQWLPMYQLTEEQFTTVADTLRTVFGEVHMFRRGFHPDRPAAALVAFKSGTLDWDTVRARSSAIRTTAVVKDPVVRHSELVASLYLGQWGRPLREGGRRNTLDNSWLELSAAAERIRKGSQATYLYNQRWNDFLKVRAGAVRDGHGYARAVAEAVDLGFLMTNWEIAKRIGHPQTAELEHRLQKRFPAAARQDDEADWRAWPGLLPRGMMN